jgi:hypothetical protein
LRTGFSQTKILDLKTLWNLPQILNQIRVKRDRQLTLGSFSLELQATPLIMDLPEELTGVHLLKVQCSFLNHGTGRIEASVYYSNLHY